MTPVLPVSWLSLLLLICSTGYAPTNSQTTDDVHSRCSTPKKESGSCIVIHKCPSLLSLLQSKPLPPGAVAFLRQSQCSFQGKYPRVCCSDTLSPETTPSEPPADEGLTRHPNAGLLPYKDCGDHNRSGLITDEAGIGKYPWIVLVRYTAEDGQQESLCEGALINKRYVLTAGRCITGTHKRGMKLVSVRIGEHNLETDLDCVVDINVSKDCADRHFDVPVEIAVPYSDLGSYNHPSHIGLLRLAEDIKWTDFIQPICLPLVASQTKKVVPGSTFSVSGWGCKDSSVKMQHFFQLVEDEVCLSTFHQLYANQLCADGKSAQGACAGNFGGPLMAVSELGGHVGMTAFGVATTTLSHDSIRSYTKVEPFMPFILDTLQP